jgi:hypothetical protein
VNKLKYGLLTFRCNNYSYRICGFGFLLGGIKTIMETFKIFIMNLKEYIVNKTTSDFRIIEKTGNN